jgi:RHS repeat-associated protein
LQVVLPINKYTVCKWTYGHGLINQNGTIYIDNKEYTTLNGNPALTAINRVHNAEGYTDNLLNPYGPFYYYDRKDHLGNIREVWRAAGFPPAGTVQSTQYYPSGLPWASNSSDYPGTQPYKYNGKEFIEMNGYDTYDYGARGYYPAMGRFTSMDPLSEKYYSISPYAYCKGNPIRFIDPNGKEVIAMDENSKRNIRNTLTKAEAKYVEFNKDGTLNTNKLNKSKSMSENIKALKAEANSEVKYKYAVTKEMHDGEKFFEPTANDKNFLRGVTEMPGAKNNPSPDKDVWVLTSAIASEELQARNTAHEGFGHAYFYELTRDTQKSSHTYDLKGILEWDSELKMNGIIFKKFPSNLPLEQRIKTVENEAIQNYEDSH